MKLLLLMMAIAWSAATSAERGHREHAAHQHGHAQINIAWSGSDIEIELLSPAINLVGFEHAVTNEADQQAVQTAVALLRQPRKLVTPSSSAQCTTQRAEVSSQLLSAHGVDDDHGDEEEEHHGHQEKHDHGHHADTPADDHREHAEHQAPQHADFTIDIAYHCDQPRELSAIDARGLFDAFPGIQEIAVQWISDTRQSSVEITPPNSLIRLQ